MYVPQSAFEHVAWPAVPRPQDAVLLAVMAQLEASQWWSPKVLLDHQLEQLGQLIGHARNTVPFYRSRIPPQSPGEPLTPGFISEIPLLTRRDIQSQGSALLSTDIPRSHAPLSQVMSSGTSGAPITAYRTRINNLMWSAFTLRDHSWHGRDLNLRLAGIRGHEEDAQYPFGITGKGWGEAARIIAPEGPAALLDITTPVERQLEWLRNQDPDYFITFPSNALRLARLALQKHVELPRLKAVLTLSEILRPETRAVCREAWGVPVQDVYSSRELGYIALQCPQNEHYHVQSEGVYIEIIDDDGKLCGPGEIGRVVATSLHNFAMPLIRYANGDYAEVGEPCSCGRGLPTLKQIVGRIQNTITLPTGGSFWPDVEKFKFREIAPIWQFQLIQKSLDKIELRLVVDRPLETAEEAAIRADLIEHLGHPFRVEFRYFDELPLGPGGKSDAMISELDR